MGSHNKLARQFSRLAFGEGRGQRRQACCAPRRGEETTGELQHAVPLRWGFVPAAPPRRPAARGKLR